MSIAFALIWGITFVLAGVVLRKKGESGLRLAGASAFGTFKSLAIRLPCALLIASFMIQILPLHLVSDWMGPESGMTGILLASVAGIALPGGPMAAFPIAVVLQQSEAGLPQLVALISGWSLFAIQRLLAYEAPIMGWRFAALRSLVCLPLPVAAGFATQAIVVLLGLS